MTVQEPDKNHRAAFPRTNKKRLVRVVAIAASIAGTLVLAEGMTRIKNRLIPNYNIEMWRYCKEFTTPSTQSMLHHQPVANRSGVFQGTDMRTNEWGLRGEHVAPLLPGRRRILLLGSSTLLGWGVDEEYSLTVRLRRQFESEGDAVEVLNAGVPNYNAVRYVELFLSRLVELQPTDIVVHYLINDAEVLESLESNWLLRNSELAVAVSSIARQHDAANDATDYYNDLYRPGAPGLVAMKNALTRLANYAHSHDIRMYLAMMPDVHALGAYDVDHIHGMMSDVCEELDVTFVDLYPGFKHIDPAELWNIPGDPHPNAAAHGIMAERLYPALVIDPPDIGNTLEPLLTTGTRSSANLARVQKEQSH